MKKTLIAIAAIATAVGFAAPASAGRFLLTYTSPGNPGPAQIWIITDDTVNAVGGHDILSTYGNVGAETITGLIANPNQPNPTNNGAFIYDNVFFDNGSPAVSNNGLYFSAGTAQFNLFSDSATVFELYRAEGGSNTANSVGTLSVSVPETSTWLMMLAGFGMLGASARYRRRKTNVAYA